MFEDEAGDRHLVELRSADGVIDGRLVEGARELVGSSAEIGRYAIVWDGVVTDDDGQRTDAAVVEAGARGEPEAYLIAQKYTTRSESGEIERIGKPLLVGMAKQLLTARPGKKRRRKTK